MWTGARAGLVRLQRFIVWQARAAGMRQGGTDGGHGRSSRIAHCAARRRARLGCASTIITVRFVSVFRGPGKNLRNFIFFPAGLRAGALRASHSSIFDFVRGAGHIRRFRSRRSPNADYGLAPRDARLGVLRGLAQTERRQGTHRARHQAAGSTRAGKAVPRRHRRPRAATEHADRTERVGLRACCA